MFCPNLLLKTTLGKYLTHEKQFCQTKTAAQVFDGRYLEQSPNLRSQFELRISVNDTSFSHRWKMFPLMGR